MNRNFKSIILVFILVNFVTAANLDSLAIIVTGNYRGRADGCVCAGGSVGGLARRASLINRRFNGFEILSLDCGGILDLDPAGGKAASACTMAGLSDLQLKVCCVTARDMFYGKDFIMSIADTCGVSLVCSNIVNGINGKKLFEMWVVVEAGGVVFGIAGVSRYQPGRRIPGLRIWTTAPLDSIPDDLRKSVPADIDIAVLLTDLDEDELRGFLPRIPVFDMVFTSSRDIKTESPFSIESATVIHPRPNGGSVDGMIIPIRTSGLSTSTFFSYPLKIDVKPDYKTETWLKNCLNPGHASP